MKLTEKQLDAMEICGVPEHTRGGIRRFYEEKLPPGDFMTAVIDNDLKAAIASADEKNAVALKNIIMWFYWNAESGTWGFPGATKKWCSSPFKQQPKLHLVDD